MSSVSGSARDCRVVGKSTVPVGTADALAARLPWIAPQATPYTSPGTRSSSARGYAVEDTIAPDQTLWESYVENKTPSAWRVWWIYGQGEGGITIITIGPHP